MRSKTSCFNKTVFRKNLTRFAPIWGVYTLCLVVGILILYGNGGTAKFFHFAYHMTQLVEITAVVNLIYAPIVAQLLFGDLYNSRMCNMLHAFPLRRENWFFTNVLSGVAFSVIPTGIMAVIAAPLLAGSIFEGAVTLSWWIFLASNLQYLCFFGMAVFCVMVVGKCKDPDTTGNRSGRYRHQTGRADTRSPGAQWFRSADAGGGGTDQGHQSPDRRPGRIS